jgi:hypothetical protein
MEGPPHGSPVSLRLTREAESSRLQLELVRRAFELLVPNLQHPVAKPHGGRAQQRSAAAARGVAVAGE